MVKSEKGFYKVIYLSKNVKHPHMFEGRFVYDFDLGIGYLETMPLESLFLPFRM